MIFSLHGRESDSDAFLFYLGTQLGKTVAELDSLTYVEYVNWIAYFEAKNQRESMRRV